MSAATADKQEVNEKFVKGVKKSAKQADDIGGDENGMEHKQELEKSTIGAAIKDKAEGLVQKVGHVLKQCTDTEPNREGQIDKKEPPIGAMDQDAAEYYAERASEKFDSKNSTLSSAQKLNK